MIASVQPDIKIMGGVVSQRKVISDDDCIIGSASSWINHSFSPYQVKQIDQDRFFVMNQTELIKSEFSQFPQNHIDTNTRTPLRDQRSELETQIANVVHFLEAQNCSGFSQLIQLIVSENRRLNHVNQCLRKKQQDVISMLSSNIIDESNENQQALCNQQAQLTTPETKGPKACACNINNQNEKNQQQKGLSEQRCWTSSVNLIEEGEQSQRKNTSEKRRSQKALFQTFESPAKVAPISNHGSSFKSPQQFEDISNPFSQASVEESIDSDLNARGSPLRLHHDIKISHVSNSPFVIRPKLVAKPLVYIAKKQFQNKKKPIIVKKDSCSVTVAVDQSRLTAQFNGVQQTQQQQPRSRQRAQSEFTSIQSTKKRAKSANTSKSPSSRFGSENSVKRSPQTYSPHILPFQSDLKLKKYNNKEKVSIKVSSKMHKKPFF